MGFTSFHPTRDQGQATIALVIVVVVTCFMAAAIAIVGQAMVHRARARNAADAIALASVIDPDAAGGIMQWYQDRNMIIEHGMSGTIVHSGPATAAAWAGQSQVKANRAPVLVAIVARAEQLLDRTLSPRRWYPEGFDLGHADAVLFRTLAAEFELCEITSVSSSDDVSTFLRC